MMLSMAERHVLGASKHREMMEEKAQKGIQEAREKGCHGNGRND